MHHVFDASTGSDGPFPCKARQQGAVLRFVSRPPLSDVIHPQDRGRSVVCALGTGGRLGPAVRPAGDCLEPRRRIGQRAVSHHHRWIGPGGSRHGVSNRSRFRRPGRRVPRKRRRHPSGHHACRTGSASAWQRRRPVDQRPEVADSAAARRDRDIPGRHGSLGRYLTQARDGLAVFGNDFPDTVKPRLALEEVLGAAYMRRGEVQNCMLDPNAERCLFPSSPAGGIAKSRVCRRPPRSL